MMKRAPTLLLISQAVALLAGVSALVETEKNQRVTLVRKPLVDGIIDQASRGLQSSGTTDGSAQVGHKAFTVPVWVPFVIFALLAAAVLGTAVKNWRKRHCGAGSFARRIPLPVRSTRKDTKSAERPPRNDTTCDDYRGIMSMPWYPAWSWDTNARATSSESGGTVVSMPWYPAWSSDTNAGLIFSGGGVTREPAMWGVTFEQIEDLRAKAKRAFGVRYTEQSMHDVNERIVIPVCRRSGTSYALALNPNGLKAKAFVTHCWDEPFDAFVNSLRSAFPDQKKPTFWICALALRQGQSQVVEEQLNQPVETSPFVRALRQAKLFVVVRNPVTDLYSRIWCICELIFARQHGLVPDKTVVTGEHPFAKSTTSCLDAMASKRTDKAKVLAYLLTKSDFAAIDEIIKELRQF